MTTSWRQATLNSALGIQPPIVFHKPDIRIALWGDRVVNIVWNTWYSTSDPTETNKEQFALAGEEYTAIRADLDALRDGVEALEAKLDSQLIPYTPHRPNWKEE